MPMTIEQLRKFESVVVRLRNAEAAAKKVGDVFGKAGGTAAKLGGALSMISPEAAAAAGAINDLGDVGEVATEIWEGAGAAIQANALVLGTLAAALVVAAAAYRAVTLEITREQERLAFEADLSKQATSSAKKLADALDFIGAKLAEPMDAEQLLFILYTSGSTGKPKGMH